MKALAPAAPTLVPGAGKAALAAAPSTPLPAEVAQRAKTGFGVPTGDWIAATASKGAASRGWSKVVLSGGLAEVLAA